MVLILRSVYEKGFFHLLTAKFLHQFLGFGILVIAAKFLSPVEVGEIRILQSYAAVFIVIAVFGVSTAILKFCSEDRTTAEKENILKLGLKKGLVTTAASLIILIFLAASGIITPSKHLSFWLIIYSFIVPFSVGTEILLAYLQSLKKIKQMAKVQAIIKLQAFVIIVAATYFWGFQGFIIATISAYIIGLVPLTREVGTRFLSSTNLALPVGFFSLAVYSMLSNGISMIGKYADIYILDHFSTDRLGIGTYALASLFMFGAMQVTATVQSISTPYFSERAKDEIWFRSHVVSTQVRMALLSVVAAVGVFLIAYFLVQYFYGEEYLRTLEFLPVLLLRFIIWSCYAVLGVALLGLGFMRYNFIVVSVVTPVGLILSYIFLQRWDIYGVAWAQVIASVAGFVMTLILYKLALSRFYSEQK